jgi:hypothetical protein
VNEQDDSNNCGQCGVACVVVGASCQNGTCVCPAGETVCEVVSTAGTAAPACIDEDTDPNNCGGCGTACQGPTNGPNGTNPGATCQGGSCVCLPGVSASNGVCCPSGETGCEGICVDEQTDFSNCGGCGRTCPVSACVAGLCVLPPCPTPLFEPSAGAVPASTNVVISAAGLPAGGEILFTTDGTVPTRNSPVYNAGAVGFQVNADEIFGAISTTMGATCTDSPVATASYTIE